MVDTVVREDKQSVLDKFSQTQSREVPSMRPMSGMAERVIGAQQVAVYRDESRILSKLKAFAAAAGSDWYYRFPVKNKKSGQTDWIEGPSIKLANDLARLYGNCEVDIRVMDLGDSWLFYARFTDFETGFSLTRPFQQYKDASRMGGSDDARRKDIAFQIGTSKAIRNVTVNALQTFADFAFEEAKNTLVDKIGGDLAGWRGKIANRINELGVDLKRVEAVVGRASADWLAPDMARIIAMMKAINDGMATLDETFPPLASEKTETAKPSAALDEFAGQKQSAETTIAAEPQAEQQATEDPGVPDAYELGKTDRKKGIPIGNFPTHWKTENKEAWIEARREGWLRADDETKAKLKS